MKPSGEQPLPLRDIHLPPVPDFWPPAPGWWLLAIVGTGLFLYAAWQLWRLYRRRHRRREVLTSLSAIGQAFRPEKAAWFAAEVSGLLRRVALQRYPRPQVASLTGDDWLRFLDETGGNGAFRAGPGKVLGTGPYVAQTEVNPESVLGLAREWINRNYR